MLVLVLIGGSSDFLIKLAYIVAQSIVGGLLSAPIDKDQLCKRSSEK